MQKKMPSGGQNEQNMNNDAANVQERQYKRMTTGPVSRVVLSMGIPAVIGMLVTSIYNTPILTSWASLAPAHPARWALCSRL